MRTSQLQLFLLLSSIMIVFGVSFNRVSKIESNLYREYVRALISTHAMFYDHENFNSAIVASTDVKGENNVRGIVAPHHLLASKLIAQQFQRAITPSIDNIIIIGPNHTNDGTSRVITAHATWETAFGRAQTNGGLVENLKRATGATSESSIFTREHSIGALVPFVKYFAPHATIVPIVLSSDARETDVDKLVEWLIEVDSDKTLIVFSIDFSHYLPRGIADIKDGETQALIEAGDIHGIMALGNNHVDSPATLATALVYAEQNNFDIEIIENMNSNDFSIQQTPDTTSYFTILVRE